MEGADTGIVYLGSPDRLAEVYGPPEREAVARLGAVLDPAALAQAEIALGTWGMPLIDEGFLAGAPRLRAVLYGAGSVRAFVTDALWDRGIRVSSAAAANAVPVADYAVSVILLSLKHFWRHLRRAGAGSKDDVPGTFRSTVGLISLGEVGRLVLERLKAHQLRVVAFDPTLSAERAALLGVELVAIDELFRTADVVSCHAPLLDATRGMIGQELLAAMKPGATFVNTSRGAVVREPELIEVLLGRPDLYAVLDVTHPEPPAPESPLWTAPNVLLTPHIAGALGPERRRLGAAMVDELGRLLAGDPLRWEVTRETLALRA